MNLGGIDTNLVVALHALLSERNVTRAARRVGLGQSAMSHALARLRDWFRDPLLVRVGRQMVLTERAQALLGPAASAVSSLERVFQQPEPFEPRTSSRVFRIASTDNLELYALPRLAAILAKEAPNVDLRFHHLPKDWMTALERGDFELKLGRQYPIAPTLREEELFRDQLICVVRRGHPLAGTRLTLRQYAAASHVLISPGETARSTIDELLAQRGLQRRIAITVSHFLVAPFVVAASDHLLTIPSRLVEAVAPALRLETVTAPLRTEAYTMTQVWAERSESDAGHRWLRNALRRAIGA
ncbi:LysR family transcriptional regulator [Vitiosangium sp. GDMCC 1.1324]|nr:LysR family transcriptional regulator [Vitiosangium sp. GDMCC 1.1324]